MPGGSSIDPISIQEKGWILCSMISKFNPDGVEIDAKPSEGDSCPGEMYADR